MKINRKLNIVIPVVTDNGTAYVHSAPISRDTFEEFYSVLGKVFSQCFDSSNAAHLALSAPQLAYPALKSIAKESGRWNEVQFGLVNEIIRLSNVAYPSDAGMQTLPLDTAIKSEILDEDGASEVLSALTFFTAMWWVSPKDLKESFLGMAASLRNWQITSLGITEFIATLPTYKETEPTGKKVKTSSVPS